MRSHLAKLSLLGAPALFAACAQLLSYDDYSARSTTPDTGATAIDASTEVFDRADGADAGDGLKRPPTRPEGDPKASGKGKTITFAVKRMYLGSLTALGAETADAWKEWGYDLDSVCTSLSDSKANINTCKRPAEANQDSLTDGDGCADNNFGHHVIGLIKLSSSGFEQRLNSGLLDGNNTWIVRIDDLDDGEDDAYAPARFYRSATLPKPKWDGTDAFDVLDDSVLDGSLDKPRVAFPRGYVRGNVWVSGEPELRNFTLPLSDTVLVPLTLDAATVTFKLTPDHSSGSRGVLSGAIPLATIDTLLYPVATNAGICPGSGLYVSLWNSIQRFPDVVIGAPNLQNTSRQCNGISLGIGLDGAPVRLPTKVVSAGTPPVDKCDAGVSPG